MVLCKGRSAFSKHDKGCKTGNEEKEKQTKKYEAERDQLLHIISSYSVLAEEQAMQNEVKELLYYVQQRLFLRYNDVFTEFINPASLRTDGNVKHNCNSVLWN